MLSEVFPSNTICDNEALHLEIHYEENPIYQPLEGSLDQTRTWTEGAMHFLDLAYLISQHYLSKFMGSRWGKNGNSDNISWAPKSLWMVTAAMRLKDDYSLEEKL